MKHKQLIIGHLNANSKGHLNATTMKRGNFRKQTKEKLTAPLSAKNRIPAQ